MMRKNYNDAVDLFKEALKIVPKKAQTLNNLGVCYMSLKDYDAAINMFMESIKLDENNALAYTDLGTVFQIKGEFFYSIGIIAYEFLLVLHNCDN